MAENYEILDAVQSENVERFELDQQSDETSVPQDEDAVGTPDTENGEQTGEDNGGSANPQPSEEAEEKTITQSEFNRIFGERANGLRRQFQREHSADLSLAGIVRAAFPGMSESEIEEELISQQARKLSEETGWDEEQARSKIKARRNFENRGFTSEKTDPHVELLQSQINDIMGRYNVDIYTIVKDNPYLTEQINAGKMDFKDAYVYYMENSGAFKGAAKRKSAPPVEKRASVAGQSIRHEMTDDEFKRIDKALREGRKVRLE